MDNERDGNDVMDGGAGDTGGTVRESASSKGRILWIAGALALILVFAAWAFTSERFTSDGAGVGGSGASIEATVAAGMEQYPPPGEDGVPPLVPQGEELSAITQPPPETLAMFEPEQTTEGAEYDVSFNVYGLGPQREDGGTLVVMFSSATPVADVEKPLDLAGRNALVSVEQENLESFVGGEYTGTAKLIPSGGLLVLQLVEYSAVE